MGGVVEKYLGEYGLLKLQNYTENRTRFGYLLLFAFQIIDFYLVDLCCKWCNEAQSENEVMNNINKYIYKINMFGFILFPLFVFNQQWYRLIRDILILNYCVFSNTYNSLRINSQRRALILFVSIISVVVWLVGDLCIKTDPQGVLIPFFTNNVFLR